MTSDNFCYWLNGFFELSNDNNKLTETQVQKIKDHLKLVFDKKTPNYDSPLDFPTKPFYNKTDDETDKAIRDLTHKLNSAPNTQLLNTKITC